MQNIGLREPWDWNGRSHIGRVFYVEYERWIHRVRQDQWELQSSWVFPGTSSSEAPSLCHKFPHIALRWLGTGTCCPQRALQSLGWEQFSGRPSCRMVSPACFHSHHDLLAVHLLQEAMCHFGEEWPGAPYLHGLNSNFLWVIASCVQSVRHFGSALMP